MDEWGWGRSLLVFLKNSKESELSKDSFRCGSNISKELVPVQTTVFSLWWEKCLLFSTALCIPFSPDKLRYPGQTNSITVWDASVLNLICLWAIFFFFFCLVYSPLVFEKLKKKDYIQGWLEVCGFFTECLEQNVLCKVFSILMLIVCCTFAKTYAVSVVMLWFAKSDN